MIELGRFAVLLALLLSVYAALAALAARRGGRPGLLASARNAVYAAGLLVTLASFALLYLLLTKDFAVRYVAEYTSQSLPPFYTISAFWAGQEGSLLLWAWVLGVFAAAAVFQNRRRLRELMPYAIAVMMGVECFFLFLVAFLADPFALSEQVLSDGLGLNPLLQNMGMLFHPPAIYLGFVGFTLPFAFAMAALLSGRTDDDWIRTTRRWTLVSWFFLGIGNILGAQWAYVELGWGGYWAWDPVENASLMPWLVGTAFLHSVMIQEKRGHLKLWNMVLIILTFGLTIFGTFITRSGVISSVHSFGRSVVGPFFMAFLFITVGLAFLLLFLRRRSLASEREFDSLLSRESSFLFNNWILVAGTFAVLWGTIYPMLHEALRGSKISVGPPFFNQIALPLGLALLFLTGICPLISWGKATGRNLRRNFLYPAAAGVVAAVGIRASGFSRHPIILLAMGLGAFVLASIALEVFRGIRARGRIAEEPWPQAAYNLFRRNKRRYGGYVVHIGVVLVTVGITGSTLKHTGTFSLARGQTARFRQYQLTFANSVESNAPDKAVFQTDIRVRPTGRAPFTLRPALELYANQEQTHTEVALRSTPVEDLYIVIASTTDDDHVTLQVTVTPLLIWLWIGGGVMALGALLALWPEKEAADEAAARKQALDAALQELDYDLAMGKLSQADYEELRARYQARADALARPTKGRTRPRQSTAGAKELEDEIEREIRARRKH